MFKDMHSDGERGCVNIQACLFIFSSIFVCSFLSVGHQNMNNSSNKYNHNAICYWQKATKS